MMAHPAMVEASWTLAPVVVIDEVTVDKRSIGTI